MSRAYDAAMDVLSRPIERALGAPLGGPEKRLRGTCWRCYRPNDQPDTDHTCQPCRQYLTGESDVDPRVPPKVAR